MKTKSPLREMILLTLVSISSLLSIGLIPFPDDEDQPRGSQPGLVQLQVEPLQQKKITSCGEAAITMAYNYLYPEDPLKELDVIAFAMEDGYYVDDRRPYTSPANMLIIAEHYTEGVSSGRVTTQRHGLALLMRKLQNNEPVIIDSLTYLNQSYSDAHFVVVTGISMHPEKEGVYIIHYNDPLTARNESARWDGRGGIWEAWQNNGDPGGSGWWMTIQATD
jgi:hypothetical protein